MIKVAIKSDKITSLGGIFHVMDVFSKLGLNQIIDSSLGQRGSTSTAFQYSDIISSLFYSYLCGADCLEDINTLVAQFSLSPKCTLPGADTVGRGLKELKEANVVYTCDKFKHAYKYNKAEKLNQLLLTMVKHLGLTHEGSSVDLDFDHQFIPAHKYDATYSYKGDYGYFPGWVHLPFSFLEQNTFFMLVTATLKNFYLFLIDKLSQQIEPLKKSSRLKKFILHFINVPAKWIKTGRRYVLNLYTPKKYYIKIFKE